MEQSVATVGGIEEGRLFQSPLFKIFINIRKKLVI